MTIPDPKRIGTYNQIDRSKQYTRADNPELLRSLNEAWSKIRTLEAANVRKDAAMAELRAQRRSDRMWIKIIGAALAITVPVIGWLGSHLYDCVTAVHQVMR